MIIVRPRSNVVQKTSRCSSPFVAIDKHLQQTTASVFPRFEPFSSSVQVATSGNSYSLGQRNNMKRDLSVVCEVLNSAGGTVKSHSHLTEV